MPVSERRKAVAQRGDGASFDEFERLRALYKYQILDTLPEEEFDRLVKLAADMGDTPTALISFIDQDRQWMKARVGFSYEETQRHVAFCHYCIQGGDILKIRDALESPLFKDNPLVQGHPYIRFYAGAPLIDPDGFALGSVCIIDYEPRDIGEKEKEGLWTVAEQVIQNLQLRRRNVEMQERHQRELERKYWEGVEEERERIGKELHDGLGQNLSSAQLFLNAVKDREDGLSAQELQTFIERIEAPLKEAIRESRTVNRDLTLKELDLKGFSQAVEDLLHPYDGKNEMLRVEWNPFMEGEGFGQEIDRHLYRIIQETLNNTIKHSDSEVLYLDLLEKPNSIWFQATDNGQGLEKDEHGCFPELKGIRSRVLILDGILTVESRPGEGVSLLIEIPKKR